MEVLGLPMMALDSARSQSEKVAQSTPVPVSRKRNFLPDAQDANGKRLRMDTDGMSISLIFI